MMPSQWPQLRRARFERAHPGVTVNGSRDAGYYQAAVPQPDGVRYVTRRDLTDLLDALDALCGPGDPPPG
jgi:hypothetical protein